MADFDLGAIVASSLKSNEGGGTTQISGRVQSPANIDALTKILQTATGVAAAEGAKQKLIEQTEGQIATARAANFTSEAAANTQAAGAEARLTTAQTEADRQAQLEDAATKNAAGLDIAGVLGKSITAINQHYDDATANLDAATKQQGISLGSVLNGMNTFGDWWDAKVTHPASVYEDKAKLELAAASAESDRIKQLQGIVSGQVQLNKATEVTLYEGAAADAATVNANKFITAANTAQEQSLATGAQYAQSIMAASQHTEMAAHSLGTLATSIWNSKRQWESLGLKNLDPEATAGYIRVALKTLGRPDADLYTSQYIKQISNNPAAKALMDTLASSGTQLVGAQMVSPDQPLPSVFGTPAEAYTLFSKLNAKLPTGTEQFQTRLNTLAIGTDKGAGGVGLAKPAEQQANINANVINYVDGLMGASGDIDSSEYGKPSLAPLISMASMNSPTTAKFTSTILKPLASANPNVDAKTLLAAVESSPLSENEKIAGLVAYANAASAQVDAVRRPQLAGFPAAASLPYSANLPTGSLFGGHTKVNLKDEKSVRDYLFRRGMYNKAKTNSVTILDAAASNIIAGQEQPK